MNESFLFPFDLLEKPQVKRAIKDLGNLGQSDFMLIFMKVKKNGGKCPLDSIMLLADGKKAHRRRILRILSKYNLFKVEHETVSFRKELLQHKQRKDTASSKEQQIEDLQQRDNSVTLFPEELDKMDSDTAQRLDSEIKLQTQRELIDFI